MNGSRLPTGDAIKVEDPVLIDADRLLDYTATLDFPAIHAAPVGGSARNTATERTAADQAIDLVKKAVLVVDGSRSSINVEDGFNFYTKDPGIQMGKGWSATPAGEGYLVVLIDGKAGPTDAIWSVDLKTHKVQYRSKAAKAFSWIPKD